MQLMLIDPTYQAPPVPSTKENFAMASRVRLARPARCGPFPALKRLDCLRLPWVKMLREKVHKLRNHRQKKKVFGSQASQKEVIGKSTISITKPDKEDT